MDEENGQRISLNIRVDGDKYALLEKSRTTGFGISKTERNRSDVYNEILGYGLQVNMIRQELGEREFQKFWEIIHKIDWNSLNLDNVKKLIGK